MINENHNIGQGKIVLGTGLVEVPEIDTKTNLPILFLYRHDLC